MIAAAQKLEAETTPIAPILPAPTPSEQDPFDLMPWLPCTLSLELPAVRFTVGDLLTLSPGSIVETACHQTSDVPLRVNNLLIGWTEFDVVGDRIAVRITDQA